MGSAECYEPTLALLPNLDLELTCPPGPEDRVICISYAVLGILSDPSCLNLSSHRAASR